MVRDTSNSDTNPDTGSAISGAVKIASTYLGSELAFIQPAVELKKFARLPLGTVLAGRVKLETILDLEKQQDIPISKRLFLGGANTVRGYAYQQLGPLDTSGNPEGGRFAMFANIEFRRPIYGIVAGVLFLDMGVLDEEELRLDRDDILYSAGAGLRLDTPVGPIRFDFGYKLNPPETIGDKAVSSPMDRWRIHFNIGHAF
jgi:outer membrane translocation and assembly module TamA